MASGSRLSASGKYLTRILELRTPGAGRRNLVDVAIAAGPLSQSDAQMLLGAVNWKPSLTWNENTYFDKKDNIANLLVNIILLCIIVGAISLAAGVAFGGARVLLRRHFPGPVFGRADQTEFISLHLEKTAEVPAGRVPGPTETSKGS